MKRRGYLRVNRSLTIKQMSIVSIVALVAVGIFMVIQLMHFVDQRRTDYLQQLKHVAQSVELPLAEAMSNVEFYKAQRILDDLSILGVLSRAEIMLPNDFRVLSGHFPPEQAIPLWIGRLFDLPAQITSPIYAPYSEQNAFGMPIGYLVLQIDSFRMYQFILELLSILVITYLLLALVLSVAIGWCLKRLLVYPLRELVMELDSQAEEPLNFKPLTLPQRHQDDELGLLVRYYNRNQQFLDNVYLFAQAKKKKRSLQPVYWQQTYHHAVHQFIQQTDSQQDDFGVLVIGVKTFGSHFGLGNWQHQHSGLMTSIIQQLQHYTDSVESVIQLGQTEIIMLIEKAQRPLQHWLLAQRIIGQLHGLQSAQGVEFYSTINIGIASYPDDGDSSEAVLQSARSAMYFAQQAGWNIALSSFQSNLFEEERESEVQSVL